MKKLAVIILLTIIVLVEKHFNGVDCNELSQKCLDCICEASTGCNLQTKCHSEAPNDYFCGPYLISWAYWSDGGKPGDTGNAQDFENCVTNKQCAEAAVRGYMTKWQKDCNNDGVIDCLDYAAIHKFGPSSCGDHSLFNNKYWDQYRRCHISTVGVITRDRIFLLENF